VRMKFVDQEIFQVILRRLVGKNLCKRSDYQVVNAQLVQQLGLFVQGIDEPDAQDGRRYNFTRMGIKSNDYRLPIGFPGGFNKLIDYFFMSLMYPVKSTDGDHGIFKFRQPADIVMYWHGTANLGCQSDM